MQLADDIDMNEQGFASYSIPLLRILLFDRTTQRNIIWASEDYSQMGESYEAKRQITPEQITGDNAKLVQPRSAKSQINQLSRTRRKAEVYTPSWMCNLQNNAIDDLWFGRKNVFNTPQGVSWTATTKTISFPEHSECTWQKYVDAKRIEISCGEAPYLVSRYDTVTGAIIDLKSRIGMLDRKLRIVNENSANDVDWLNWTIRAFQSIYAYEFQGDSLLLARENLLLTFIDNVRFKLLREPTEQELRAIATIVSWNLWQMDATTFTIPYGKEREPIIQTSLFDLEQDGGSENLHEEAFSKLCRIKDWRSKSIIEYKSLMMGVK